MKNIKIFTLISKILMVALAWIAGLLTVTSMIVLQPAVKEMITGFLGIKTTQIVELGDDEDAEPLEYYKTEFSSIAELQTESRKLVEDIVGEGSVLLKNELVGGATALPLKEGDSVSLFDVTCVDPVWGGTGSGNSRVSGTLTNYPGSTPTYKEAFESAGLTVNSKLWNWYSSNPSYKRTVRSSWPNDVNINGVSWSSMPESSGKTDAADAAIFILGRMGGEDHDRLMLTWNAAGSDPSGTNTQRGYLMLSDKEKTVLTALKDLRDGGTFKKLILLINSSNQPEMDFLTDNTYGFDAALWVGGVGQSGLNAVGKILTGKINPSGRLTDMYWNKHADNPVHANFGTYAFNPGTGPSSGEVDKGVAAGTLLFDAGRGNKAEYRYVAYQEGLYLGYRYAETRYEDTVLGRPNAGTFDYKKVVAYPFGYGMTYTDFTYSNFNVTKIDRSVKPVRPTETRTLSKTDYIVKATVKNVGDMAGKEVVQVYMQRPYLQYDVQKGIAKPSIELVGFAKTNRLNPGDTQEVKVVVDEKYFAAYDAAGSGTFNLTEGEYFLATGKDSHDALNNILAAKNKTMQNGMTAEGNKSLAEIVLKQDKNNTLKYKYSDATGAEIRNLFDFVDINRYEGRGDNSIDYISRDNWNGTVKFVNPTAGTNQTCQTVITKTPQMQNDLAENMAFLPTVRGEFPTYGAQNDIPLAEMGLKNPDGSPAYEYNDKKWDDFLDQLTWDDYLKLLSDGKRKTAAIDTVNKPRTLEHNGPIGFIHPYLDAGKSSTAGSTWPSTSGWSTWPTLDKQSGHGGLSEIGVDPDTKLPNRSVYGKDPVQDPDRWKYPTAFPSNPVIASTFNIELIKRAGEMIGEDGLWGGYNGIYGTGVNIHRSPYAGRAFEYYSEDAFLSGTVVASWTKGCQSKGTYVYNKHFVLNEQEYGRYGISTFVNEQTLREIYLRAFEIPIVTADAKCIMGALNRVGVQWASACKPLNTDWLRGEAGLSGFTVTDWWDYGTTNSSDNGVYYMQVGRTLIAGNDLPDGILTTAKLDRYKKGAANENSELAQAMRESAHRIMFTVAHSNAMGGFTVNTRVITIEPEWPATVRLTVTICWVVFGIAALSFAGLTTVSLILKKELAGA